MIKALFFDVDGTLLTSSGRISKKTIEALKACREKGIRVFTATGRAPLLTKMLQFDEDEQEVTGDGGVFCNGACIHIDDTPIYNCFSEETLKRCLEILLKIEEINIAVHMENERHTFRYGLSDKEYAYWGLEKDELYPFEPEKFTGVIKIVFWLLKSLEETVIGQLKAAIGGTSNIYTYDGGNDSILVEIVDKNSNKMLGIKRVAAIYGWEDDEVAVFGDDCNDIEMLRCFKNSFAMGNARDEVKACAGNVTLSNNEEGIYHALHNILKII